MNDVFLHGVADSIADAIKNLIRFLIIIDRDSELTGRAGGRKLVVRVAQGSCCCGVSAARRCSSTYKRVRLLVIDKSRDSGGQNGDSKIVLRFGNIEILQVLIRMPPWTYSPLDPKLCNKLLLNIPKVTSTCSPRRTIVFNQ